MIAASEDPAAISLLHRLDTLDGMTQIAATDRARLRAATFLDGREVFWRQLDTRAIDAMAVNGTAPHQPALPFMFHMGFCGSTLLARMIDEPGEVLCLREPQALLDVTAQRHLILTRSGAAGVAAAIRHPVANYAAISGEQVVVKPSSWINGLLPDLVAAKVVSSAVFLRIEPRAFLIALFRGGRDRLAYAARQAEDTAKAISDGLSGLQRAIARSDDPLDRMAHIGAFLHDCQQRLFDRARRRMAGSITLEFADLLNDPAGTAASARSALGLPDSRSLDLDAILGRHAKSKGDPFDRSRQDEADAEIERLHGHRFDAALERHASGAASQ